MKAARSKWRFTVFLVVIAGVFAGIPPSISSAYYPARGCGGYTAVARDYLAQVKRAAPIKEVPASGELPFTSADLRLSVVGSDVIVGRGEVGFSLSNPSTTARHLNLIAESKLVKVNARGKDLKGLGVQRRRIGAIQEHAKRKFLYRVSATPAYYRVDIRFFHKGSDRVLNEYSTYARVMRRHVDLRVRIERYTVAPGEFAKATLLNLGTVPLITRSYDFGFNVEAFTGEEWIIVPDNPPVHIPKILRPWVLPAGTENRSCLRYLVSSNQAPGLFRFVTFGAASENGMMLTAEFQVASSS